MGDTPRVEFALGSEVSLEHFFKSSFARSFVTNYRDSKSLDYEFLDNIIAEEVETNGSNNNNFFSLVNFESKITNTVDNNNVFNKDSVNLWKTNEVNVTFYTNQIVRVYFVRKKIYFSPRIHRSNYI